MADRRSRFATSIIIECAVFSTLGLNWDAMHVVINQVVNLRRSTSVCYSMWRIRRRVFFLRVSIIDTL